MGVKRFLYLPSGYKRRSNTVVVGRSQTGEVSQQGLVSHTESWDGRVAANVQRSTIRYVREPDGTIRPMTFKEMVAKGYFTVGEGPSGFTTKGKP